MPGARAQAKDISTQALKFTSEFALLVHTYPVEFVDAALLPASKEAMKFAFRYVWAISEPDMRVMAEVIYLNLSRFQEGVGVVPIAPEPQRDASSTTADEISPSYLAWTEKTEAEIDELLADIQDWKRNPPPQFNIPPGDESGGPDALSARKRGRGCTGCSRFRPSERNIFREGAI